jgi:hypothetical protein
VAASTRPFTIRDGIVLVVATAVALGLIRVAIDLRGVDLREWGRRHEFGSFQSLVAIGLLSTPVLFAWTVALILLGFSRSRPRMKGRFNSAGMAACGGAVLLVAVIGFQLAVIAVIKAIALGGGGTAIAKLPSALVGFLIELGWAVPGTGVLFAWASLPFSSGWRAEANWHDRAGRALGVVWVAMSMLWPYVFFRWM